MKIVGITACTAGIAHTYLAKEKLSLAAKKRGHEVKIETQGTIGVEDRLTDEDIKNADVVIIAADIGISGRDRFAGKKVVEIPTALAIKSPSGILEKIEAKLQK